MPITPLTFSGISSYSTDFQTVLERAVKIAPLPLKLLQNDENADVLGRKTQLASLGGAVADGPLNWPHGQPSIETFIQPFSLVRRAGGGVFV